jgi:hypothetical protein
MQLVLGNAEATVIKPITIIMQNASALRITDTN